MSRQARSLNNTKLSDFDRVTMKAAPTLDNMVEREQAEATRLAASKLHYLESLQPPRVDAMTGASVQLDSGAMKDDSPFEVRSLDSPVHPLVMLGVALTYPPDGKIGASAAENRAGVRAWLSSALSLEKVQQREAVRQRAAPYVATLRKAGVHTVRQLLEEGVSLMALGFPLPLRDTLRRELKRLQAEDAARREAERAAQVKLARDQRNAERKNKDKGLPGKPVSAFVIPEGLLRSERQVYAPKNFVGKLVKPTRARQQALEWLRELDRSYGVAHLDDPHDKFVTYVFLRFLGAQELEDFERGWKEVEQRRNRGGALAAAAAAEGGGDGSGGGVPGRGPVEVEPEVGDTFVDFLQNLVQKDDAAYRKVAMSRRSQRAFKCAEATILLLKRHGYQTVRSLLLCPLEAVGVAPEPAAEIALGIKKMSKANPWLLTKFR